MDLYFNLIKFVHLQVDPPYTESILTLYFDFVGHTTLNRSTREETKEDHKRSLSWHGEIARKSQNNTLGENPVEN